MRRSVGAFAWKGWCACLTVGLAIAAVTARAALGAPVFGVPGEFLVDGTPIGVGVGAFDAAAGIDIVTANDSGESGPSFSILRNRGMGSFFPQEMTEVGGVSLQALEAADFTADGMGDFAVAADDLSVFPSRGIVLVYRNAGGGEFERPLEYRLPGLLPSCLESGDVDGDGVLDLLACHAFAVEGDVEGRVTILSGGVSGEGVGDGTFRVSDSLVVGIEPSSIAVGPLDGDGFVDLVIGDAVESTVYAAFGTPLGFEAPVAIADVVGVSAVTVVELPGQGASVVAASGQRNRLLVLRQAAPRVFDAPVEVPQIVLRPGAMVLEDFVPGGMPELAVLSLGGADLFSLGDDGAVDHLEEIFLDFFGMSSRLSLAAGDVNGDGLLDIAASSSDDDVVVVALNGVDVPATPTPTPSVTSTPTATAARSETPAGPGDANCDGVIDGADLPAVVRRIFSAGCRSADVNGDGAVSAADVTALLLLLADR